MAIYVEKPTIHIDMFSPAEKGAPYPKALEGLKGRFFGDKVGPLFEVVKRGSSKWDIEDLKNRVDLDSWAAVGKTFGFSDLEQTAEFYLRQQKRANAVIEYITTVAMPGDKQRHSLLSEVATESDRPSDAIEWLAIAEGWESPAREKLQQQVVRQLTLAGIAAGIQLRSRDTRTNTTFASVKKALTLGFYEYPGTKDETVYSVHNNATNRTESVGFDPDVLVGSDSHMKSSLLHVRSVNGVGRVLVEDRVKRDESAIIKAVAKAKDKNEGWVKASEDVVDMMGVTFTVLEPDGNAIRAEKLENKLIDYMRSHSVANGRILGRLLGFIPDDKTDPGRNKSVDYKARRLQAVIEGKNGEQTMTEFVIKEAIQGWDHKYMIGEKDPETGLYKGTAHPIYQVQRIIDILPLMYPEAIYGAGPMQAAMRRLDEVAAGLKQADRFDRITPQIGWV